MVEVAELIKTESLREFLRCDKCGICCILEPCQYGMWDERQEKCALLTDDNLCGIYEFIKDSEIGFGQGCGNILLRDVYAENKERFRGKIEELVRFSNLEIVLNGDD